MVGDTKTKQYKGAREGKRGEKNKAGNECGGAIALTETIREGRGPRGQ